MTYIILGFFILTIIFVIAKNIIKYGFDKDAISIILNDVVQLRGVWGGIFWLWICITMMMSIDNDSKWYLTPFLIGGISIMLILYEKTKKIGYITFFVVFFGSIFLAIFIAIYNEYFSQNDIVSSFAMIFMILVFSILAGAFIYNIIKKR